MEAANRKTLSQHLYTIRFHSILLVVFIHVLGVEANQGVRSFFEPDQPLLRTSAEIIHTFNMAVMLIGSGIAVAQFGKKGGGFVPFLKKRLDKLLVPLVIWAPIFYLIQNGLKLPEKNAESLIQLLKSTPESILTPYAIFWFVHALAFSTLLAWVWNRFSPIAPERKSLWVWFLISAGLHALSSLGALAPQTTLGGYLSFVFYWNGFFALGMAFSTHIGAWLLGLQKIPLVLRALIPLFLLLLMVLFYLVQPFESYESLRRLHGPIGFFVQLSWASVLLTALEASPKKALHAFKDFVVRTGSITMALYLFHIHFLSGTRMALLRLFHTESLWVHIPIGMAMGFWGPWLLWRAFRNNHLFMWSLGMAPDATPSAKGDSHPRVGRNALDITPSPQKKV